MTTTCGDIQHRLSDFADGLLDPDRHALVLAHVRQCADCSGVLSDLERLLATARHLGPIAPPDHIWLEVAGQLRTRVDAPASPARVAGSRRALWQWIGLSAALLAITTIVYEVGRERATAPVPPVAGSLQTVNDELTLALEHYQRAVTELEAAARAGDGTLDPAVAATMQTSLTSIDRAIAESRAALLTNPDSEPARDSLFEALRRKISVLQTTLSLINDMQRGDPAGASRPAARLGRQS